MRAGDGAFHPAAVSNAASVRRTRTRTGGDGAFSFPRLRAPASVACIGVPPEPFPLLEVPNGVRL